IGTWAPFFSSTRATITSSPTTICRSSRGFRCSSSTSFHRMCFMGASFLGTSPAWLIFRLRNFVSFFECPTSLPCDGGAPVRGKRQHAFHSRFEQRRRAGKREPQKIFPCRAKRRPGDPRDACFFEQAAAQLFCGESCLLDVHPRVKRAFGRQAAEAGDAIEPRRKGVAALAVLRHHGVHRVCRIAQRLDGSHLRKLVHACPHIHHQQIERVNNLHRRGG